MYCGPELTCNLMHVAMQSSRDQSELQRRTGLVVQQRAYLKLVHSQGAAQASNKLRSISSALLQCSPPLDHQAACIGTRERHAPLLPRTRFDAKQVEPAEADEPVAPEGNNSAPLIYQKSLCWSVLWQLKSAKRGHVHVCKTQARHMHKPPGTAHGSDTPNLKGGAAVPRGDSVLKAEH